MKDARPSYKAHPLIQKTEEAAVPIARLIGFSMAEIGDGRAVGIMQAGPQHANPMGTLHGGVLCDLADAAIGTAFASTLDVNESFTTVDLRINFFRPVWNAPRRSASAPTRQNVGYIECGVTDEKGELVARASSTCLVLRGEAAKGR